MVLKLGNVSPPTLFIFFKFVLAVMGPLNFPMNFRIQLVNFYNESSWDLKKHLKNNFYFRKRERECRRGAEGARQLQAGSTLSVEPDMGLDPMTLGS